MALTQRTSAILFNLMGNQSIRVGRYPFPVASIDIGSAAELRACRNLADEGIATLYKVNPDHAFPSYYMVAGKDRKAAEAEGFIRQIVTLNGEDVTDAPGQ